MSSHPNPPPPAGGRGRGQGRGRWKGLGREHHTIQFITVETSEQSPNREKGKGQTRRGRKSSLNVNPEQKRHSQRERQERQDKIEKREKQDKQKQHDRTVKPATPRNGTKVRTVKATLTTLPPELRWKIYSYLFEATYRVSVLRLKHKTADHSIRTVKRLYHQRHPPRNPKTQGVAYDSPFSSHNRKSRNYAPLPLSLILTCKVMYRETLLHFYANTQFVFHSTRALARFLHTTSTQAQSAIHHIELNHIMYNEPRLLHHRLFKHRSDLAFYLACEDLAIAATSLRVLHVNMRIWDWPIRLEVGERWSWPLLTFARYGRELDFAKIRLEMCRFEDEALKTAAGEVEKKIMKAEAIREREETDIARAGVVRAGKVLRVFF